MACISHLAYEPPEAAVSKAESWGYDSCEFFDCNGTQAYVMMDEYRTVVAFRGTEPNRLEDWVTDFRRRKQPVAGLPAFGKIHSGFDSAFTDAWASGLASCVANSQHPVYVTGHSLGGALAMRSVTEMLSNGWPVAGLYTYGQPRVGNRTFAREFNKRFKKAYRFVHNNDIVPRVPWVNYWHAGQLVYLTTTGEVIKSPTQWRTMHDRFRGRWRRWIADGIRDHNMNDYKTILATNLESYQ